MNKSVWNIFYNQV